MSSLIIFIVIIVISQIFRSFTKNQREAARRQAVEEQRILREEYEAAKRGFSPQEGRENKPFMPSWEENSIPVFFEELPQEKPEENISTQKRFTDPPAPPRDVRGSQRPQKKIPVNSLTKTIPGEEKNRGSNFLSSASKNGSAVSLQAEKGETRVSSFELRAEQWDREQIIMGVIMAEVLGPPKSRKGKQAFFK